MKINIIKHKWIFLGISIILVAASLFAIGTLGFKTGIDFTGGSLWQIKIPDVSKEEITTFFEEELSLPISNLSYDSKNDVYSLTFREIEDKERQEFISRIKEDLSPSAEEKDFWSITPSVSEEIKSRSISAIIFVLVGISLYIAFAFRKVSEPISSWKYGFVTLITLLHDVAIPAGMFAILSYYLGITLDTNFVVALLVVMGFSVHDTIVVFDRVRENLVKLKSMDFDSIINHSVSETIRRSINTSVTLILVLISLYYIGPADLKYFILTMLVGTIVGTYSSIFVASPLLSIVRKKKS